jgi:hypothetical protein
MSEADTEDINRVNLTLARNGFEYPQGSRGVGDLAEQYQNEKMLRIEYRKIIDRARFALSKNSVFWLLPVCAEADKILAEAEKL